MFKKSAIALLALSVSLSASANWSAGAGYMNLSSDTDGVDISLNGIYGSVAYDFQMGNENFSIVPELRIGTGLTDDTIEEYFDNELNEYLGEK